MPLPQSLDFIRNGYKGDTEAFKYRSDRASSVEPRGRGTSLKPLLILQAREAEA